MDLKMNHTYLVEVKVSDVKLDGNYKCTTGPLRVDVRFPNIDTLTGCLARSTCYNQQKVDESQDAGQQPDEKQAMDGTGQTEPEEACMSHMFQMDPEALLHGMTQCSFYVNIYGSECPNTEPSLIGCAKFYLTEGLVDAVCQSLEDPQCPITATMSGTYALCNVFGEAVGEILVCLRLSCFGQASLYQGEMGATNHMQEKKAAAIPVTNIPAGRGPMLTGEENLQPGGESKCPGDSPAVGNNVVPWRLSSDKISQQPKQQPVCTCRPPTSPGPAPPSSAGRVRCECADILASLRSPPPFTCPQPPITPKSPFTSTSQSFCPKDNSHNPQPAPVSVPQNPTNLTADIGTPQPQTPTTKMPQISPSYDNSPQAPPTQVQQQRPPYCPEKPQMKTASQQIPSRQPQDTIPTSKVCGIDLKNKPKDKEESRTDKLLSKPNLNPANTQSQPKEKSKPKTKPPQTNEEKKNKIKKEIKKKKKLKTKNIYTYTTGMYPGQIIGHKYCTPIVRLVPRNMGWLWNIMDQNQGDGWMPGAMVSVVHENFAHWKVAARNQPHNDISSSLLTTKKKKTGGQKGTDDQFGPLKPTLHVHKKDGHYYISVHPAANEELPPGVKPLNFKVDATKASSDELTSQGSTEDSFEFQYNCPASLIPPKREVEKAFASTQYHEADFMPKHKKEPVQQAQCAVATDDLGKKDVNKLDKMGKAKSPRLSMKKRGKTK